MFKSHHERGDSLVEFANKMRSMFLKSERHGDALSDLRKGQLFLNKAKMPQHIFDRILAKTNGSREFSKLYDVILRLGLDRDGNSRNFFDADGDEEGSDDDDSQTDGHETPEDSESEESVYSEVSEGESDIDLSRVDLSQIYDEKDVENALEIFYREHGRHQRRKRRSKNGASPRRTSYRQARRSLTDKRLGRNYRDFSPNGSNKESRGGKSKRRQVW